MDFGKEFEKYAVKDRRISSNTIHGFKQHSITNLTPYIIEERPLNVASMDVFSRLMMDRIIFFWVNRLMTTLQILLLHSFYF